LKHKDLIDVPFVSVLPLEEKRKSINWLTDLSMEIMDRSLYDWLQCKSHYTACCWSSPEEEMSCAKLLSLFTIDSSTEMKAIHLILLVYHWLFKLGGSNKISMCKSCCLFEGAHCPCYVQSEPHIDNTQYFLTNLSGIVAVAVTFHLFCISGIAVMAYCYPKI